MGWWLFLHQRNPFLYDSVAFGGDGGIEVDSISNFTHSLKHYFGVLIGLFYTGLNILHKQRLWWLWQLSNMMKMYFLFLWLVFSGSLLLAWQAPLEPFSRPPPMCSLPPANHCYQSDQSDHQHRHRPDHNCVTLMETAAAVPAPCPVTVQAIMFLIAQWDVLSPATHLEWLW